jgi:tetratricopeptide (TPR) repeat protein
VSNDPAAAFERAFGLHRDGKLAQALTAYEAVLRRWPGHVDALHYSGLALYQTGRLDVAAANIEHSLKIAPGSADAWCNLALVYQAQGSLDKAVAARCRRHIGKQLADRACPDRRQHFGAVGIRQR